MAEGREQWRRVRARRAEPLALAGQADDRKQVFQSALAQAEELWDAAAVVGPASRPLPLFYCVSQAGRAVCAAWTSGNEWRPKAHGLKRRESDEQAPGARVFDYATKVASGARGSYRMVASATRSRTFSGFTSVAELWMSLPGWPTSDSVFAGRPRCLTLEPISRAGDDRPALQRLLAPTHALVHPLLMDTDQLTTAYPAMIGITQDGTRTNAFGSSEPVFKFVNDDGSCDPSPMLESDRSAVSAPVAIVWFGRGSVRGRPRRPRSSSLYGRFCFVYRNSPGITRMRGSVRSIPTVRLQG